MNANEVANNLTHGTSDISITLIEGMRKEEMAEIISKILNVPSIEIVKKPMKDIFSRYLHGPKKRYI